MLARVVEALSCPVCASPLRFCADARLACDRGHSFDVARQGYVNLLPGGASASTADTPEMVAGRREFLAAGYFAPVTEAVAAATLAALPAQTPGILLDAGGGTGEYLSALLTSLPSRIGLTVDVSKHAARHAARAHPRAAAVVADVWDGLPVRDGAAALVTNIFAPRNPEEFARVLAPAGVLLVVTPTKDHLAELVTPLGLLTIDPHKQQRLADKLDPLFMRTTSSVVEYTVTLPRRHQVVAAVMGPSGAHLSLHEIQMRAQRLEDPTAVTVSVNVATYARRLASPAP